MGRRRWKYLTHGAMVRAGDLRRDYGLTPEDYRKMAEKQQNRCAICGRWETHKKNRYLAIDHNHVTGKIRGLLCSNCNAGLGFFEDNPQILANAIEYLKENNH